MSTRQEENDIYIIPPNFIDTGTVFGGTIKLRNAAEALTVSLLIGLPVFHLPLTLTTKIIIACLTVLPAALFAIIGINGESLTSFVIGKESETQKGRLCRGIRAVQGAQTSKADSLCGGRRRTPEKETQYSSNA